jgi:LysW-gamma-L-lysine carboxypeptidase
MMARYNEQQDLGRSVPKTLLGLVRNYSPSGQEAGAVGWLVDRMDALGYTGAYVDKTGNAVGLMGEGATQIVLLGHIDTVPGEIPVRICETGNDTNLYGRGTVDAKSPLAAFVDAVARVGPILGVQLVVIGGIDEERESIGARAIVNTYQPAYAIIGEPSRWDRITLGYKGSAWADVTVQRPMTHRANRAETAPEIAIGIWTQVQVWAATFNQGQARVFDQVTPTLSGFSSRQGSFVETATLNIGVRLPQGLNPTDWYRQLKAFASGAGGEVHPTGFPISAYRAERKSLLVRAFSGGIRAAGGRPGFVVKTGTADLNIVAPVWGCPAVAYGPGDSSLDHTPDEHVSLDEFNRSVCVLQAVLQRLANQIAS